MPRPVTPAGLKGQIVRRVDRYRKRRATWRTIAVCAAASAGTFGLFALMLAAFGRYVDLGAAFGEIDSLTREGIGQIKLVLNSYTVQLLLITAVAATVIYRAGVWLDRRWEREESRHKM